MKREVYCKYVLGQKKGREEIKAIEAEEKAVITAKREIERQAAIARAKMQKVGKEPMTRMKSQVSPDALDEGMISHSRHVPGAVL